MEAEIRICIVVFIVCAVVGSVNLLVSLPECAAQLKRIAAALEKANDLYMKQNGINRFKDS